MKKLIFLLFPVFSYGQITVSEYAGGYSTSGVASISSKTYEAGHVYFIFAGTTNSATPATVSISGGSTSWTLVTSIISTDGLMRLEVFRYAPASNTTTGLTISYTGSQNGGFSLGYDITGAQVTGTNGSDAIVQSVTDGASTSANPTITMAAISNPRNAVICGFINNANPFGGTPESGWTEEEDNGYNTPNTGGYVMYRLITSDNTPTVTAASSTWAGIAIEIRASGRRIITTN